MLAFTPAGLECVRAEQQEGCTAEAGQVMGIWHLLKVNKKTFLHCSLLSYKSTSQSFLNCPK